MEAIWTTVAVVVVVFVCGFELYALIAGKTTFSRFVWNVSMKWPLLPFATGMLCGHFFWQVPCP